MAIAAPVIGIGERAGSASGRSHLDHSIRLENDAGYIEWTSFRFEGVRAFRLLDEELGTETQFEALDRVLEIYESEWLSSAQRARRFGGDQQHHYRIYFDDYGCYEVLSARFHPPGGGGK